MAMFRFITEKPLWKNILAGFLVSLIILIGFLFTLNIITNHGEYLVIPDVKGKNYRDVLDELERKGFDVVIQDSIYIDSISPERIIKQFPEPDATVKVNRTIYLTVNCSVPPTIKMPNLIGMSFRNAILELKSVGLKLGDTSYADDIAKNVVKDQLYSRQSLKPGSPIRMGTAIDLVIGVGLGGDLIPVPDLYGLTFLEAKMVMEVNGLVPGLITLDENISDTSLGYVYWQNPLPINELNQPNTLRAGQLMDLKISLGKPANRADSIR
jgi:beta-lactam-binding protein with PASTA domain